MHYFKASEYTKCDGQVHGLGTSGTHEKQLLWHTTLEAHINIG
jgi:hypothetical protein